MEDQVVSRHAYFRINFNIGKFIVKTVKIYDLVQKRVLVTRDSARTIQRDLAAAMAQGDGALELDLEDIGGLTPSFFDETLTIIEENAAQNDGDQFHVTVKNPPTRLSSKYVVISRAHGLIVQESESGTLEISRPHAEPLAMNATQTGDMNGS